MWRNFEFNPEQVTEYIRCWFAATEESLDSALVHSKNSRFKELIQNSLRFRMLCQIWQMGGRWPETPARLFGEFVD